MGATTKKIHIGGMTCANCQYKIEKKLQAAAGVRDAKADYIAGTAVVSYDPDKIPFDKIVAIIEKLDYEVLAGKGQEARPASRVIGLLVVIAALYMLLEHFGFLNILAPGQLAETNMGYGLIFVVGLVTSMHCVAMCGGINLSQSMPGGARAKGGGRLSAFRPAFLYNLGRVASYTAIGFVVGALGSAINFSSAAQGGLKLVAGVFMIVMGINMLNLFPGLRKFIPGMPRVFAREIDKRQGESNSPLIVGALNGFMPCGPLQAMQVYALSTGSAAAGALSMFLFCLGTVPLMFGLGAASAALGRKFTRKAMTAGAVLVVALGLSVFTQGISLSGGLAVGAPGAGAGATAGGGASADNRADAGNGGEAGNNGASEIGGAAGNNGAAGSGAAAGEGIVIENGVQIINSSLSPRRYPAITVQKGLPVKWVIHAPQGSITGCNYRFFVGEYGIDHTFAYGENIIEFTPADAGTFRYSCWMGMIRGAITVVDAGDNS